METKKYTVNAVEKYTFAIDSDYSYGIGQQAFNIFLRYKPDAVPSDMRMSFDYEKYKVTPNTLMEFYDWVDGNFNLVKLAETSSYKISSSHKTRDAECDECEDDYENSMAEEVDDSDDFSDESDKYYTGEKHNIFYGDSLFKRCAAGVRLYLYEYSIGSMALIYADISSVRIIYDCTDRDKAIKSYEDLFKTLCIKYKDTMKKTNTSHIYQICYQNNSFYLSQAKITYDDAYPFELLYPDEFLPIADNIDAFIKDKNKSGMIILHGTQGSGKTSYIRKLVNDNPDKDFIYLPMTMAGQLSSPDFVTFVHETLKNSVIIIEDCEQLLESRDNSGSNAAISTILNMSDGLLSDELSIKFICTFNSEISKIDKALLRKGRLIDKYEFSKLNKDKATALGKKIYGDSFNTDVDLSLAEIFNNTENHGDCKKSVKRIGFY